MIDNAILPADLMKAREMLSNVPQDMFDMFLVTLVEDIGWPFESKDDDVCETDWCRVFYPFTLRQIVDFKWIVHTFIFDTKLFCENTLGDARAVVQNCFGMLPPIIKNYDYERCRKSTLYHFGKLMREGHFAPPIAVVPLKGKLKVLDGNHRIAAALMYETLTGRKVEFKAWLAE